MASPTEDEVQAQWRAGIDIIDQFQVFTDGLAADSQEFDVLVAALEGDFTFDGLTQWLAGYRTNMSDLLDSGIIRDMHTSVILEYGKVMQAAGSIGSGLESIEELMEAIYEHFISVPEYVESRAISFDTSQALTGTGNGELSRLNVDENGFDIENCHVETKTFRCMRDQNSGVREFEEEFLMFGETRSRDNILWHSFGSGDLERKFINNQNAGAGNWGSIARNSSFESYDVDNTNDFTFWELVSGTVPTQSTSEHYLGFPGDTNTHSLTAAADFRLKQSLINLRRQSLTPNVPFFIRVMVKDAGSASGGNVVLHLGSKSVTVSIATIAGSGGWYEVLIVPGENSWFKNINQDDFNIEFEWSGRSTGTLLFDDLIFCEMTQIDGLWWVLRNNDSTPVSWLKDDEIKYGDTQADITKGKINYHLFRAGLGYLPSSTGTPTITFVDP